MFLGPSYGFGGEKGGLQPCCQPCARTVVEHHVCLPLAYIFRRQLDDMRSSEQRQWYCIDGRVALEIHCLGGDGTGLQVKSLEDRSSPSPKTPLPFSSLAIASSTFKTGTCTLSCLPVVFAMQSFLTLYFSVYSPKAVSLRTRQWGSDKGGLSQKWTKHPKG